MSTLEERSVIGCLLMDNGQIHKIYDTLKPEMFSDPLMRDIYREIVKAYDIGQPSNLVTITQAVECDTFPREHIGQVLKECVLLPITSRQIGSYADSLAKEYKARELKRLVSNMRITAADVNTQIADLLRELEALKKNEKSRARQLSAIVGEYQDQYFKEQTEDKLYTGFSKLDDITGGLEGGDMIVIGARPGVGKSAFISQIILEAKRFLGDEQERFQKANDALGKMAILISSGAKSVSEIRNECRHHELDCIIIDYLQLVKADIRYQSRASEVGAISKAIKALAMELNIPIIALSQLNRVSEIRETKEPTMGELREAGDIEQDASIIILLWNLDTEDISRKGLKVDKNRQGELGKIVYRFDGGEMKFIETDEEAKSSGEFKRAPEKTPFD